MRVRLGHLRLLAVAALLAPLTVPGAARASDTEIVIEGSRSSYVDITVRQAIPFRNFDFQISTAGSYTGLVIEARPWSRETSSQTTVIAFRAAGLSGAFKGASRGQIEPGSYRVWILGDRRPRVVIPVMQGGFEIRPTGKATARMIAPRTSDVLAGVSGAEHRYERALPGGWSALMAVHLTGQRAERSYVCAAKSGSCPAPTLPLYLPSTQDSTGGGFIRPAKEVRDLLAGTEGLRLSSGRLESLALVFTA